MVLYANIGVNDAGFVRSLGDAPSPATLTTYDEDGTVTQTPVWFRWRDSAFDVVIAEGDSKLRNLRRDPRFILLVFESVPPFRGVQVTGNAELIETDVTEARQEIAGRYLGADAGARFADQRKSKPGVLVRLTGTIRTWDLAGILT